MEVDVAGGFDEEPPAVLAADDGERGFGRAEDADAFGARCSAGDFLGEGFGEFLALGGDDESCETSVRRQHGGLAHADLAFEESLAVTGDDGVHHGMIGQVGLDEATATDLLAAGAAGDLVEELEGAFAGTRISLAETEVTIDDADSCKVWEVVTFGDELRADDDVGFALLD